MGDRVCITSCTRCTVNMVTSCVVGEPQLLSDWHISLIVVVPGTQYTVLSRILRISKDLSNSVHQIKSKSNVIYSLPVEDKNTCTNYIYILLLGAAIWLIYFIISTA
jgi:hypothetical protein